MLDVHHIDCDRENNNCDNLIILCANHHAKVHRGNLFITDEIKQQRKTINIKNMKYKIGDKVTLTDGNIMTIDQIDDISKWYRMKEDPWNCYTDEMIEGLVEEEIDLIPKFGEYSDNEPLDIPTMTTDFVKEHGFPCPDGYEFRDENGNVINAMKIILKKKK